MSAIARNTAGVSRLVWTAGIVVGASLPHWTSQPFWTPLLLVACVGWRFGARLLGWPLPARKLMWLVTIGAFGLVLLEFRTVNGLVPGTALLIVMISLKFLETRSQRDHMLLTVIAYFLVFAGLLTGGGMLEAAYLLAFVWITTLGLLQVGRRGPLLPNAPTAKLAARLLVLSLPVMIVLFLLFPRLPGPLWALPGEQTTGTTGLAGSMSPGDLTELGLSDEIALRVEFTGQTPAPSELYWRGPVLTLFDGRTWSRLRGTRGRVADTIEYLGLESEYRVTLEPDGSGWAFALDMPEAWSIDDRRRALRMGSDYQLRLYPQDANTGRISYTVTSHSRYRAREPLTERERRLFTELPVDRNPRTRALVDGWLEDSPDAATIIERGLDVFRQPEFFYTLTPPALGQHTADDFIFETREGFCEHYASAFAIMMRMAGLPTRVVTGYQGGELNSYGDYYVVRDSDAHAWTEVWSPDDGWVRVDPVSAVAPERISLGSVRTAVAGQSAIQSRIARARWLREAALAWDAVNTFWDDWIIGYGPAMQRSLLERFGFDRPRRSELLAATVVAVSLLLAAMATWFGLRMRRATGRRDADRAARVFARFTRLLARHDVAPLADGETASAYAKRARVRLPACAPGIDEITRTYLAARYEPDRGRDALTRLEALVERFRPRCAPASR